jgi:hypothetical protein
MHNRRLFTQKFCDDLRDNFLKNLTLIIDNLCGPQNFPKKAYLAVISKRNNRPTLESTTVGRVFNSAPELPGIGAVLKTPPPPSFRREMTTVLKKLYTRI